MISQQRNISSPVGGGQRNLRAENLVWLSPTGDTIRRRHFIEVLKLMVNTNIVEFLSDNFFYLGLIRIVEATLKYRKCL